MCRHDRRRLSYSPRRGSSNQPDRRQVLGALGLLPALGFLGLSATRVRAADAARVNVPAPGPEAVCPVCGMFVAKYPEWIATVVYSDGKAEHFDGAKDFFKFLADVPHYAPGREAGQITAMGVTDYYSVERIDPRAATYVIGSDVLGPMGHELVPHASLADGEEFFADHAGKKLVAFDEVTPTMLANLDAGRFE